MNNPKVQSASINAPAGHAWPLPLDRQRVWIVRLIWASVVIALALWLFNIQGIAILPAGAGMLGLLLLSMLFDVHARANAAAAPGSTPQYLGIALGMLCWVVLTAVTLAMEYNQRGEAAFRQSALLSLQVQTLDLPYRSAWLKTLEPGTICGLHPEARCTKDLAPYLEEARKTLSQADETMRLQSRQTRP
jgi:hypothetical protein